MLRDPIGKSSEYLSWDDVRPPLLVRSRRPGDRFFPLGGPGSKKVSDYLSDAKVPPEVRKNILLVCDQVGIIWVVGHRIDNRVRLDTDTCDVLHLAVKEIDI